ncbi:hypothetical protein CH373_10965 [Leptospira perolatii]|uniref:LysM domain-containing protein n=1 Tax=Leptospira perolatii TaxID=2023191 RepID=A0A2M9ZLY1_9LEPT|nr:M23 family metallopeptidase [Leptospira perolatii]PJZ69770.1 hypothetical protein CH360_09270 [Leptospira perolatii]PJZ73015.1 hypothetical protein CH373_10965 [Leptospira perolatii]
MQLGAAISVPTQLVLFALLIPSLLHPISKKTAPIIHKVRSGETAFSVSRKYGVHWKILLDWNGKKESEGLKAGEILKIPRGDLTQEEQTKSSGKSRNKILELSNHSEGAMDFQTKPRFSAPLVSLPAVALPFSNLSHYPNKGVLFKAGRSRKVRSISDGKVAVIDQMDGYRKFIIVEHKNGFSTVYANLKKISVKEGQIVSSKESVGELEEGKGLYFQLNRGGKALDPFQFIGNHQY